MCADLKNRPEPQVEWEDDVQLAKAAADGHPIAEKRLVARVMRPVGKTLAYLSNNMSDVDDLTQLALIEILESARSYRGEGPLTFWADRIAIRTAAKCFETRRRREGILARFFNLPSKGFDMDETVDSARARDRLSELLAPMSHKYRTAIILKYLKGYSLDEISEIMACKKNTVQGLLRRGKRRLKKSILRDPLLSDWLGWME